MKNIALTILLLTPTLLICAQKKKSKNALKPMAVSPAIHLGRESRFMINLHSGYAVGMGATFKFYPDDISTINIEQDGTNAPAKTISYGNPTKGLGDGFKFGFGASYIVNDFINIGLDFDYFNSTIYRYRDSTYRQTNIVNDPNNADEYLYSERNTIAYKATLLSLTPNVTFKAISGPKWFLYNKLGAVITFRPNSLQEDATDIKMSAGWQGFYKDSTSRTIKKYEWGIRNPSFGLMAAFGGQVKLADRVRFYGEAQFSHIVFVIKKRTLTDFIVDERHLENNLPVNMRELEFVKSYSSGTSGNDPNLPAQTIVQRIPITYLGFQVGLAYQL